MSSIQETNLKAIADAIRAKNGTTDPIQASTFPDLIAAISTGMRPRLIVQTVAGATVTATKGEYSYSGTANDNGLCHFELPASDSQGEWAVTSSLNGTTVSSTIKIGTQTLIMGNAFDSTFSNNDWPMIIAACQSGNVPSTWAVGDSKTMTIDGTDYQIDIIGKDHDEYADGSGKAPLTLQMHECENTFYKMGTSGLNDVGWKESYIRSTVMPALLEKLPDEVKTAVREVSKQTGAGNAVSAIETTVDKLFLPSLIEITGAVGESTPGEGTQYPYYETPTNRKKKTKYGTETKWWTRSPTLTSAGYYMCMNAGGSAETRSPTSSTCVSAAWCF